MDKKGLYIHIPFCKSKCNYCDFYSLSFCEDTAKKYTDALIGELKKYAAYNFDTLYLGGGTPTVLGRENLETLLKCISENFGAFEEATLEANPADDLFETFKMAKHYGINRVSLGVQSGIDEELVALGRRHTTREVKKTVDDINRVGIENFSLDLMLGIPNQTEETLQKSVRFLNSLCPKHISSYLLKIEEGTLFYKMKEKLNLPDSDMSADLYLKAVAELEKYGFLQYEISNFSKKGYESKHNLKYWNCEEYVGIGPAAHGFIDGKRYYYERDLESFIKTPTPVFDSVGGGFEEYFMLKLRLVDGINLTELQSRFSKPTENLINKAKLLESAGYVVLKGNTLSLTKNGFLVSNTIISQLLDCI